MSAYSPYQGYPGQQGYPGPVPAFAMQEQQPPPIFVAVADPAPQGRLGVFFRGLLIIPQSIALYVISIVAMFVLVIGWFGALFSGQLPSFAVNYLSGCLRWSARVAGYQLLLTGIYPPFSMEDDTTYPVRVAIPAPQLLNRAAVFFRYFLVIPAAFIVGVVGFGAFTIMAFVAWLITLFTGQLPASFHLAYVAVLRYQVRVNGYYWMLTPAYPGGLFGDEPGTVSWADQQLGGQAQAVQSPGYSAPGAGGYGTPGSAGYGTPAAGGYGAQGPSYGAPPFGGPGDTPSPGYGTPPQQGYGNSQGNGIGGF